MVDVLPVGFRELPNNVDAEQALLGAILINNEGYHRVAHLLRPDHFYEPVHRRIFAKIGQMIEGGQLADPITLKFAFKNDEALKEIDGSKYLDCISRAAETILNVEDYANVIRDLAVRRAIIHVAQQATNRAYEEGEMEPAAAQLSDLANIINSIGDEGASENAITPIDAIEALEMPRPAREWIVDDWVPKGRLTLMAGDGGTGKSLLAQQLATSTAIGRPWLGQDVHQGRVLLIATEDDADELTIRHQDICRDLGASADDVRDGLKLVPRVGLENRIVEFDSDHGHYTPTWYALCRQLDLWQPALVILDNAAQLFAGNENSRPQVTWFCNRLEYLCQTYGVTVILLGHTSKAIGSEWSGSTAWNACVRSRLFLGNHEEEDSVRVLTRAKSNYAKKGGGLELKWDAGVMVPFASDQGISIEELGRARQTFKDAIDKLTLRDINVSHLKTSPRNYAPKVIKEMGLAGEHSPRSLEKAMLSLIDEGAILTSQPFGRTDHGNKRTGIKRAFAYEQ